MQTQFAIDTAFVPATRQGTLGTLPRAAGELDGPVVVATGDAA
jgi:hypothetical protein